MKFAKFKLRKILAGQALVTVESYFSIHDDDGGGGGRSSGDFLQLFILFYISSIKDRLLDKVNSYFYIIIYFRVKMVSDKCENIIHKIWF